jgi:signal transduction histidine kinase
MSSRPESRQAGLGLHLAWWYAVLFLVGSIALVGITYVLLAVTLRDHDREIVQSTLVQFAAAYTRGGSPALTREIQRTQVAGPGGPLFVRIVGRSQDLVFVSMPERWQQFDLAQLASPSLSGEQSWATLQTGGEDDDVLEVLSIRFADGVLFQVGKSTERRTALLRRFRRVLLFNLGAIIVVGLAGGAVLTWTALQPVRALAATVDRIMRTGQTSARVPITARGDAIADLSAQVNAMLDRIDAVVAGMRGALDNVAHDLRTPMARLRSIAESAIESGDPDTLRNALASCVEESDRIMGMLSTLMDISEAETGTMALRLERTSVAEIVAQTVALYEDVADEAGVQVRVTVPEDLFVDIDRARFRQALANLLDNAIKYTPAPGTVQIRGAEANGEVTITVEDTGVGIPVEELPHIWTRLYRGDKSRSTRGLGLGLSLVKAIVEAHRGSVAVESTPGQGSRFDIRLRNAELRTSSAE